MLSRKRIAGFTFLELMVVIGILGILLAIAVPNYTRYKRQQNIRNAANELTGLLKYASQDAKKGERSVGVIFRADSTNGGLYYDVARDINDDSSVDNTDVNTYDDVGNKIGLIQQRFPSADGARIWGAGIAAEKKLIFGKGGEVQAAATDLTLVSLPNSGYYSIMISPQDNVSIAGETFEIRVYWDGKVEVSKV